MLSNTSKSKPNSTFSVLKIGSLVRVTLPMYEGKMAIGVVSEFQIVYAADKIHLLIWVEMILDGVNRPFEPENLAVLPRIKNGFDHAFVAELLKEAA